MSEKVRKALVAWQLDDAARLKALVEKKRKKLGLSQAAFAEHVGFGTQGALWQYANGTIPLNLQAAYKFAIALECAVQEFSPTIAEEMITFASVAKHRP